MKIEMRMLWSVIMVMLTSHCVSGQPQRAEKAVGQPNRMDAARTLIETTTMIADKQTDVAARLALYRSTCDELQELCSKNLAVSGILKQAVASSTEAPDREKFKLYSDAFREVLEVLAFKHHIEAPLPEGFPEPTPVGEIQIKQYPAYRMARTQMAGPEAGAFWTLFTHIQKKDIAMTAPVEMTYGEAGKNKLEAETMAFLYRTTKQGKAGTEAKVEVVDVAASLAVSLGTRGDLTKAKLAEAKAHLDAWLTEHSERYEASGPLRVMGYNSPFVAANRRFTEVEIPVRPKTPPR